MGISEKSQARSTETDYLPTPIYPMEKSLLYHFIFTSVNSSIIWYEIGR